MSETISPSFTFTKDGVYYFSRRIPFDLICHYTSQRIAFSLRTRSTRVAEARARKSADQLDEYWFHLRSQDRQLPGKHMLRLGMEGAQTTTPSSVSICEESVLLMGLHISRMYRPQKCERLTPISGAFAIPPGWGCFSS